MSLLSLLFTTVGLLSVGVLCTLRLVRIVPLNVLERSELHGRFAHLGAAAPSVKATPQRAHPVRGASPAGGLRTA